MEDSTHTFSTLPIVGKVMSEVVRSYESVRFVASDGQKWLMEHETECCEEVYIEDINGNLSDLVGTPILVAEVASADDGWAFYRFSTIKGDVSIRWNGHSESGCYSLEVKFVAL